MVLKKQEAGSWVQRVPSLDGLRACSVALVVFDHLGISRAIPFQVTALDLGNLGVRIFFVISGFIITRLLLEELHFTGSLSLKQFYIRRFFRIVPIWACFVAVMLLSLWRAHALPGPLSLLGVFTFNVDYIKVSARELQHLWSLSVEEKFYLLWPATLLAAGRRRAARIAVAVMLAAPLFRYYSATHGNDLEAILWRFHNNADAIAAGCLLAFVLARVQAGNTLAWLSSPYVTLAAIAALYPVAIGQKWGSFGEAAAPSVLNLLIAVAIFGVVSNAGSFLGVFLNLPALRLLGLWSYGIYLWQQPLTLGTRGVFPFDVLMLLLLAIMGYYLIERRAQAYGRRVATGLH